MATLNPTIPEDNSCFIVSLWDDLIKKKKKSGGAQSYLKHTLPYLPFPSLSHLLDPHFHLLVPKTPNSIPCKLFLCPIQSFPLYGFKVYGVIQERIHIPLPLDTLKLNVC